MYVALWYIDIDVTKTYLGDLCIFVCGGVLASWLVHRPPDRAVQF